MPIEVAERILRGEAVEVPEAGQAGRQLMILATRYNDPQHPEHWYASLKDADEHSLIAAIGAINESIPGPVKAFREAARAMVDQKLTDRMVGKMEDLERASTVLAERALFIGRVGTVATIVGTVAAVVALLR